MDYKTPSDKQIIRKFDQAIKQGYNKTYQTFRKQFIKENKQRENRTYIY